MALPRHANEESCRFARMDFLQATALQHGAGGPLFGARPFDALQHGEDARIRIQNFNSVGHAICSLFQNKAQDVAAR